MDKMLLICQQCGGTLEITSDMEVFKCKFCDTPYLIKREADTVRVVRLEQRVEKLEVEQKQIRGSVASIELEKLLREREAFIDDWNLGSEEWQKSNGLHGKAPLRFKYRRELGFGTRLASAAAGLLLLFVAVGVWLALTGEREFDAAFLCTMMLFGVPGLLLAVRVAPSWMRAEQPAKDEYARRIAAFDQREASLRAQLAEAERAAQAPAAKTPAAKTP